MASSLSSQPALRRSATCAALLLLALMAPAAEAQEGAPVSLASRASLGRALGSEGAPIFVYEFADFQCGHCAKFALEVFPRIDSAYVSTGKVRWIFVNLPAPTNANAWAAHEAAACASGVADGFWAMHDQLFETQAEWRELPDPRPVFERLARAIGVPADPFATCLIEDRVASVLLQDVIFAASSRISGTPAFIVNNSVTVMGVKSFREWTDILERALKKAK